MPLYTFSCSCGHSEDHLRSMKERNRAPSCKNCKKRMKRSINGANSTDHPYEKPIYSNGAGILRTQVAEHRRRMPHIPVLDDGRLVFTSHNQRRKVLKEIGLIDKQSFC